MKNNRPSEKNSEIRKICRMKTVLPVLLLIGMFLLAACAKQPASDTVTDPSVTTEESQSRPSAEETTRPTEETTRPAEETSAPVQTTEQGSAGTTEEPTKPDGTEVSPAETPGPEEIELPKDNF